jgi:hypothetical protein
MAPIPKPPGQRRRRNRPAIDPTVAESDDERRGPRLIGRHCAVARRWYESLRRSGQSAWYQPSDWAFAEIVCCAIDGFVAEPRAAMLTALVKAHSALLGTEADRRRAQLFLTPAEREEDREAANLAFLEDARARLRDG